jgi:hypothetical protein
VSSDRLYPVYYFIVMRFLRVFRSYTPYLLFLGIFVIIPIFYNLFHVFSPAKLTLHTRFSTLRIVCAFCVSCLYADDAYDLSDAHVPIWSIRIRTRPTH